MFRSVVLSLVVLVAIAGCLPTPLPELDAEHIEGHLVSEMPGGWRVRGPRIGVNPEQLGVFMDDLIARSGRSACILSVDAVNADWGTLMQDMSAERFRGKRVRFSGWVKAHRVSGWAGLWMGVDTNSLQDIAYDDMEGRPIRGTSDWQRYEVVLDVDPAAAVINFGIILHGKGQVWLDDCRFVIVDKTVPVTDEFPMGRPRTIAIPPRLYDTPVNMNFDAEFLQ
jgi:hypothetical protein